MSENIYQVYQANPITTNASTDLMYFGQSPYGAGNDAAMTFANFNAQIVASGTTNQIGYYAASGNKISPITGANNGVLITGNTGVPSWLANSGTPGFVLTANSGAPPSWQSASASGAITTIDGDSGSATPSSGILTISGGSTGLTFTGASHTVSLGGIATGAIGGTGHANTGLTINLGSGSSGYLLTSDSSGNATWAAPGYLTGAVLLNPGTNQTITTGSLTVNGGFASGSSSGGGSNAITSWAPTTNSGNIEISASNSAGNFQTFITNASMGQGTVFTIPDPGSSSANFILNKGTQSIGTGLTITSPTLVTPTLGAASATSINFTSTSGIIGATTNNNAAAGSVGEYVNSIISEAFAINITTNTATDITSISLTAGDWDVWGNTFIIAASGTVPASYLSWCSQTSASIPDASLLTSLILPFTASQTQAVPIPQLRMSLSATTTIYLSIYVGFSVSTLTAGGAIYARRRR